MSVSVCHNFLKLRRKLHFHAPILILDCHLTLLKFVIDVYKLEKRLKTRLARRVTQGRVRYTRYNSYALICSSSSLPTVIAVKFVGRC